MRSIIRAAARSLLPRRSPSRQTEEVIREHSSGYSNVKLRMQSAQQDPGRRVLRYAPQTRTSTRSR